MLPMDPLECRIRGCAVSPLYVPVSVFLVLCLCPLDLVEVEIEIA
jgi:hypothetical protein